jgi:hypothetical protein
MDLFGSRCSPIPRCCEHADELSGPMKGGEFLERTFDSTELFVLVCAYARVCVCVCVCMYVRMYVFLCVCECECVYVCMHACMYACIFIYLSLH